MRGLVLFALLAVALPGAKRTSLIVLSTTDLHGNIYPVDYATDKSDERGLAKAATVIERVRREGAPVLLVNCGDTLAGTALAYHHATRNPRSPEPMMAAMNRLRFDAMVVGNHEYDFGWEALESARQQAEFPWLAANVYFKGSERTFFEPYVVRVVGGVRVGILGLTTTAVPNWDDPARYLSRIDLRDPLPEAARWVKKLRESERVDVVVAAMHMGLEEDPSTGERIPGQLAGENRALAIARQVPGIDLMLLGHTHREVVSLVVNGVLLMQPAVWGRSVARADLMLEKTDGRWRVVSKTARSLPVAGVEPDAEILAGASAEHSATEQWLSEVVGQSDVELRAGEERFGDSALLDMVHRVQLEAGGADVSLAESVNPTARIPQGAVTVRDLFGLFAIEKKLVTLDVTGRQLREALEHSARYFRGVVEGKGPEAWVDPKAPNYNYYIAEGVSYELDVSRPVGERIRNLRWAGKEVRDDQHFRLATNNYLANGAAGYVMFQGAKVLGRSQKDLRELLVDWARRTGRLRPVADGNWRLLPETAGLRP